ncbi:amino acid adenylation domain-containing protein [Tumebacillus sp. BK434]|uniref:non-ribosomal peptide synthetase n=1 Tax=Tumebacillus sp. BK434 TaxID=2512169 RepID=UPI0010E232F2|nr:non-ribosomal peptide synthetase [Tumebacillus sp. BK434]TCP55914.1 amino acid adenylation domain-containing protein [Tumebacillus sp. BK434]
MTLKENIQDIYSLSPMQKGMLLNHAVDPTSAAYTEQFDFRIGGEVEPERMQWALNKLSARHDILRTVFSYRKTDEPRQVVLKSRPPEFTVLDLRDAGSVEMAEAAVEAFKTEQRGRGFDLSGEVLVRGALLQLADGAWSFVFTFHHILLDGWSLAPLFQELFGYYDNWTLGAPDTAAPPAQPYADYIRWLQQQDEARAAAYWQDYLEGYEKAAVLPTLSGAEGAYAHATHVFQLPASITAELSTFAKERGLTVNTVFQTAWGVVLQKYNYTRDVVFGNVVSGRPAELPGIENMVGLFINTQPLRIRSTAEDTFAALCAKVHQASFASFPYEYYPLYEIQSSAKLKNNLLHHIVAFENYPLAEQLRDLSTGREGGIRIEAVHVFEQTNYDFHIVVNPGAEVVVNFTYNANRYSQDVMEGLQRSLLTVLEAALAEPEQRVDLLPAAAAADRARVLEDWNGSAHPALPERSVHEVFRDVAAKFSAKIALKWNDQTYTYRELDAWSDRVALHLQEQGLSASDAVGLLLPRCPEMVAGMLGILKIGASFVPLDMANSAERLQYMIEDAGLRVVCTRSDLTAHLPQGQISVAVDQLPPSAAEQTQLAELPAQADRQAYLMYTSGSSGQPKGCKITHRNILRLVFGPDFVDFGPEQVILQTGSPAFDASTFEVWGALLHGGTLVLVGEEDLLEAERLQAALHKHAVRTMWLTSPLFNRFCEENPAMFATLETLVVGGDALSVRHIRRAQEHAPHLRVVNGYGPTENTTFSTTHLVTAQDLERERIPIGKPLAHSTVYIVDQGLQLLPPGAIGEICVGGDGVGLGYLNKPEQTAKQFLPDPFAEGGRMYRTGDLGRWLPDGTVDYIGRTDFQVKIRGYRVELGEIERALEKLPQIKEVTVQIKELGQDKQLCAYYTSEAEVEIAEWRKLLAAKLPPYMIPSFFVRLETMPLTVNGKIDAGALPDPMLFRSESRAPSRAQNEMEQKITDICAAVLGVPSDSIGLDDHFFEIGINSLNMIAINNRLKAELQRNIPLTAMFEHTSVALLADYLNSDDTAAKEAEAAKQQEQEISKSRGVLVKSKALMRRLEEEE